jgi:transcriptional regulator
MLIHPGDAAISGTEWRDWLAGHDFGQLAVNLSDDGAPHVIPTHFAVDANTLLVHLARPNKVWAAIQARPTVVMSVVGDYAYIPTTWRAKAGGPDEDGVPTSYYAAIQLTCQAEIVDDSQDKAELLRRQLAHFQPQGDHAQVAVDMPPYGRMLSGIRGLHLHITCVAAKFKYDDHNSQEHRARVAERLESRGSSRDRSAAAQQRRRLQEIANGNPALSAVQLGVLLVLTAPQLFVQFTRELG